MRNIIISRSLTLIFFSVLTLSSTLVQAQTQQKAVFRFLNLPVSARAAALGGNNPALFNADPIYFQLNPAYLGSDIERSAALNYINQFGDVNSSFINTAFELGDIGNLGVGLRYTGYGEFDRLDETGTEDGNFRAYDMALSLGLGRKVGSSFSYGVGLDLIQSSYDVYQASGLGLSGGFRYEEENGNLVVAGAFSNVGLQLGTYNGTKEPFPTDVRVGVSIKPEYVPARLSFMLLGLNEWDQSLPSDEDPPSLMSNLARHLAVGTELVFSENVNLRLGYNHYRNQAYKSDDGFDFAGLSLGFGIHVKRFTFDFSRNGYSDLGGTYQLGIRTKI
jgi:hypothetical protein